MQCYTLYMLNVICCTYYFGHSSDQTCVSICPGGYYADEEKQECIQCHESCASCHGHHSNDCVTCKSGLLLLGHSCFPSCPPRYDIFIHSERKNQARFLFKVPFYAFLRFPILFRRSHTIDLHARSKNAYIFSLYILHIT